MEKIIITQDQLIQQAKNFAFEAHKNHHFPCGRKYSAHLETVADHCKQAISQNFLLNEGILLSTALLHDSIEDTNVTHEDLFHNFGQDIADSVSALTKDKTLPKALQMQNSLQKILALPKEVWMVKLADRIANLQQTMFLLDEKWSNHYKEYYRNESILIFQTLGESSSFLSQKLNNLIKIYNRI